MEIFEDIIDEIADNKIKILVVLCILLGVFSGSAIATYFSLITVFKPAITKVEYVNLMIPIVEIKLEFDIYTLKCTGLKITLLNTYDYSMKLNVTVLVYNIDEMLIARGLNTISLEPKEEGSVIINLDYLMENVTIHDFKYSMLYLENI